MTLRNRINVRLTIIAQTPFLRQIGEEFKFMTSLSDLFLGGFLISGMA